MRTKARDRAKRRGVPFRLSLADILAVWPADGCCPVLGTPLVWGVGAHTENSPSLDRVVPELGYVPGNVAVLSRRANLMKHNATAAETQRLAEWQRTAEAQAVFSGVDTRSN